MKIGIIVTIFLFFVGCQNETSLRYEGSYLLNEYVHHYENDKKTLTIDKFYIVEDNIRIDSSNARIFYTHNQKGLLVKEERVGEFEENNQLRIFKYNIQDSLIQETNINYSGDTVYQIKYKYFSDGKKVLYEKNIFRDIDYNRTTDLKVVYMPYDTAIFSYKYFYQDNFCRSNEEFDKYNKLTHVIDYEYSDNKKRTEKHYIIKNDEKVLEKITFFDFSKSSEMPDHYSLNPEGDTVDMITHIFTNENNYTKIDSRQRFNSTTKTIYVNGKDYLVKDYDNNGKLSSIQYYEYYSNGDLKINVFQ